MYDSVTLHFLFFADIANSLKVLKAKDLSTLSHLSATLATHILKRHHFVFFWSHQASRILLGVCQEH